MASVSVTQTLPVDAQTAWDNLLDLASWEKWLTIHQGWKSELPTDVTVGTRITEVVSVMGMANKIEWDVTSVEAPTSVAIEGAGMAGVKVKFAMEIAPADAGSTITMDAEFNGTMIVGPIGKAVAKNTQADLEASLAKFAELVNA
ncbi:type II toxin-antitoxin system Rv0910 family toxin [Nocardioides montaniterrae]